MKNSGTKSGTKSSGDDVKEPINGAMLEVLVCPITGGALEYDAAKGQLISRKARRVFPIRGGIPIMLVDESLPISD